MSEFQVIAQRVIGGQFLSWDVPLKKSRAQRALSGPGGVFGTIDRELANHGTADDGRPLIEQWSTALYVVDGDRFIGGGIVKDLSGDGPRLTVGAPGFCGYPTGIPHTNNYQPDTHPEALSVFRYIWNYVQGQPDGDLGMTVDQAATSYYVLSSGNGPFHLDWYQYRDCGSVLDAIAEALPCDYRERHFWTGDRTIGHHIDLGFPRLGSRRTDLRFTDSENIVVHSTIGPNGDRYTNDAYVFGIGEDQTMRVGRNTVRDGRLRRPSVVTRPAETQHQLDVQAQAETNNRQLLPDITSVTVQDHPNARLGDLEPGDDILVQMEVEWFGDVEMWLRILAVEESSDNPGRAVLSTQRSDSFTYAAAASPTGDNMPVAI